jgi:hypothetical protein
MKHVAVMEAQFADAERDATAIVSVAETLAQLAGRGVTADDPSVQAAIIDLVAVSLDAFDAGVAPDVVLSPLVALPADQAAVGYQLLICARFPDGSGDTADLDDATILVLAVLSAAAGDEAAAVALIGDEVACRPTPHFLASSFAAMMLIRGHRHGLSGLWNDCAPLTPADRVDARLKTHPLDVVAHRARARHFADSGDYPAALNAVLTGISLPVGGIDKLGLAEDLAVIAAILATSGGAAYLGEQRVKLTLGANAAVARHAVAALDANIALAAVALPEAIAALRDLFADYAAAAPAFVMPYPTFNGRPHVDMLFLEITDYCNQKCTFCPDMHRETPRNWLPLAQVKALIDQIADTLHLNMLQLNAYGEPLLHPNIDEILAYIRTKDMPWPTIFTTHGMTLVDKKLRQLSHNYPTAIAVSMHNDNQESYAATRSAKIGDYDTLIARITGLVRQMVNERAPCNLRLYQMVTNGHEDTKVDPTVRGAFPDSPERMALHIRKWEGIVAAIAAEAPADADVRTFFNPDATIENAFHDAIDDCGVPLPLIEWTDTAGHRQQVFLSGRPVETYANLLLEYHPDWEVERTLLNAQPCRFFVPTPSLTIFATGKLGFCCLDLHSTATFGSVQDYPSLADAMNSQEARQMFAELANGVAVSKGCQICLGEGKPKCGTAAAAEHPHLLAS